MTEPSSQLQLAPGEVAYDAPMSAVIVDVAAAGSQVAAGGQLALLEAMKMQYAVIDPADTRRWILTLRRR